MSTQEFDEETWKVTPADVMVAHARMGRGRASGDDGLVAEIIQSLPARAMYASAEIVDDTTWGRCHAPPSWHILIMFVY